MRTFFSYSPAQTEHFAASFARSLSGGSVVAFTGGLGAGKTTFIRGLMRGLGNPAAVSSPTYAIVNDYGGDPPVYHFDMYRVSSAEDLHSTGFYDYLDGTAILLIEWSENIQDELPEDTIYVDLLPGASENARVIRIRKGETA